MYLKKRRFPMIYKVPCPDLSSDTITHSRPSLSAISSMLGTGEDNLDPDGLGRQQHLGGEELLGRKPAGDGGSGGQTGQERQDTDLDHSLVKSRSQCDRGLRSTG